MKVTESGFILYRKYEWEDKGHFLFAGCELDNYITVRPHTIEYEIPDDFNPIPGQVAALEAEKQKLKADFAKRMMEIEDSISKLTCITMDEVTA